jgi:Pyruvate/2-oxoacid:ferredoxin oxidoreductase delta subunit
MKRSDERDIMFSRMARKPNTKEYDQYYSLHPELLEIDDTLRAQMPIGKPGDRFYDSLKTSTVDAAFQFLDSIKPLVEGPTASKILTTGTAEDFTAHIKSIAELYGASVTGVAKSDESFYYSHRGRTDQVYGDSVSIDNWPHTIVFAVPMNEAMIRKAPKAEESIAVTQGYVQAAIVGMILTYTIKAFGYEARNHMDGNYLCTLPLAAKAAGIGDIGQHGLIITEAHGPRVRLGAVSTNLPLVNDPPFSKSIASICETCRRCVRNCPSKAIPNDILATITQEKCFEKWLEYGTDCGICLSVCPGFDEGK